ncbi:IS607 family transposase ISTko1 [Reticulibacter mediterranei]|uniref:IS607 family transposase ISTko1 n=1 Tax=Reticulibacter mediterranei TaxID=2778369 RepID=A0A8J3N153_9CHLR|nr:IS607 family transposase [Reticulibacter mediterranei]GHO94854.1 IS607 family transposase ISTko1 [Reticulibacter mediterranei]
MSNIYSPKEFGKLIGRTTNTLQKWDREGRLKAHRSPTNRRYYTHDQYLDYRGLKAAEKGQTIVYARVSGVGQKPDLLNQIKALETYCQERAIPIDEWMQDIGSGLNYKRKQFNRLMEMVELGHVRRIIIAHHDRLVRFGYGYFEAFCERHNTQLIVVNGDSLSPEQELVQDLMAIITVFGARLHGLRSYKKAIKDAALHKDQA